MQRNMRDCNDNAISKRENKNVKYERNLSTWPLNWVFLHYCLLFIKHN